MYKRILVATDGSELSHVAVQHALRLAQATGAEVVALKVVPKYPQSYFEGSVVLGDEVQIGANCVIRNATIARGAA